MLAVRGGQATCRLFPVLTAECTASLQCFSISNLLPRVRLPKKVTDCDHSVHRVIVLIRLLFQTIEASANFVKKVA